MSFPSSKKQTVVVRILIYPDGRYTSATGSVPPFWLEECEVQGAMIRTISADVPVPMELPVLPASITG